MAANINKVILIGRLGQDPKLTYLPSGAPVAELRIATSESYKNKDGEKVETTEWHTVKVWNRSAEACANYLRKGSLVYVEGTLRTRTWEDPQGQKKYFTEVSVTGPQHTVQFMDSKSGGVEAAPMEGGYGGDQRRSAPPQQQRQQNNRPQQHDDNQGPAFPSEASGMDDVPF